MAYIGAEPVPGQNREVDDISSGFNGSATSFTLQVSSTNVSPESANNIFCLLYTSPSPRDLSTSRMPSSA